MRKLTAKDREQLRKSREAVTRARRQHSDVEIRNVEFATEVDHPHAAAMCEVVRAIIEAFPNRKLLFVIEAEIARLGRRARPEDVVAWVEDVGTFVLEVKSHRIEGIRSFENSIPQVIYSAEARGDKDLLEQPRSFAYDLRNELQLLLDDTDEFPPALYWAGWLPFVTPSDVHRRGCEVSIDRVWLSDMLDQQIFLERLSKMKNLTRGRGAPRTLLPVFAGLFGCTSGLRVSERPRTSVDGSLAQLVHERERLVSALTPEQEGLAFSPQLVRGPKVIRGVVGSGKTVVLANAIANLYLRHHAHRDEVDLFDADRDAPRVLVLCFNTTLVPHLRRLTEQCFEHLKPRQEIRIPHESIRFVNIDKFAFDLCRSAGVRYDPNRPKDELVNALLQAGVVPSETFDHIFLDEGQDIDLGWYPLIRALARSGEAGPSIVVFYDEAQNVYGVRRPGTGGQPSWTDLLGAPPNARGLRTVMRVGHRNTNEILGFSFNLLLGSFSDCDPQMAVFTNLAEYKSEKIPDDPRIGHPNAGKPCVEEISPRQYRINFALHSGPMPDVHKVSSREALVAGIVSWVRCDIETGGLEPEDILVLTSRKESELEILRGLERAGVPCHAPHDHGLEDPRRKRGGSSNRDFRRESLRQPGHVSVSTIKSSKGYTAPAVHVAFVDELEAVGERGQLGRAELHVACTRATTLLHLWATNGSLINEAQDVREAMIAEGVR